MEGVSVSVYRRLSGYWRKRGYERLSGTDRRRKTTRLGLGAAGSNRRRRFWRIKNTPKLRLKLRFSPKKFFCGLRDAYVKMMLRIANSCVVNGGGIGGFAGDWIGEFGMAPLKEYDERMIIQMYKSIVMAQGQLVSRDAARIGTEIVCHR
ncbi:unnamed protein product [Ilex paraguariensis]|uniref:Uncharacterized protein n=1 Tax=Ilex paraguariensis TaxID=185542 RepID=A0ABC8UXJ3_9AQUA